MHESYSNIPIFFTRMRLRRRWQRQPRLSGLRKLLHPAGEGQQPFEQQLQQRAPTTAATAATEALWLGREAAGRRQPSLQVRVKMRVSRAPKKFNYIEWFFVKGLCNVLWLYFTLP